MVAMTDTEILNGNGKRGPKQDIPAKNMQNWTSWKNEVQKDQQEERNSCQLMQLI